ncbi:MAG TPA: type I secretion system permease/ATPase [Candidatus Desulfovibrio intestinipullorum]|uniref:Type I secretion system permease/ATPase n=1 Tax=Candidatus Desulfovibrio intestinipullorum TaxID=2838536 RepID=A0A9D1TNX1_9BACT|nr:type I secretion system permease/ATPase [Candidatus Desulfovibrio intestinipullorum]
MSDLEKNSSDTATTTQTAPSATTSPTGAISNESAPARPTEPSSARQASVQARTGAPQNLSQSSGTPLPRSVPADSGAPETRTAAPKISIRPAAPAQASGKAAVQPAQSRQGPKISVTRHEPGQTPGHKTVQTAARTGSQAGGQAQGTQATPLTAIRAASAASASQKPAPQGTIPASRGTVHAKDKGQARAQSVAGRQDTSAPAQAGRGRSTAQAGDTQGSAETRPHGLDGTAAAMLRKAHEAGRKPDGPMSPRELVTEPLRPSDVDFMPGILRCMALLLRLKGVIVSPQFLMAGLNGSHVTPEACLRVARKAGLSGRILYRPRLEDIPSLTLPCILLLSNDRACVLVSKSGERAQVIFPETENTAQNIQLEELRADYSGYALFASVESKPDERTESFTISKGKRWFWDVLSYYAPIYRHVALASVITNLIAVATPLFVMNVYDRVVPNAAMETLWVLAIGVLIAYVFDFLLRTMRVYFVDVAGRNADVVLSSTLVNKVLGMRLDAKPESTGALTNNLREFDQLRDFFSSSTLLACIDVPFLAVFIIFIGIIAGPMCLLPICAIPVLVGLGLVIQGFSRRCAEASYKQNMQKNALLVEIVNGLETIKSCQAESRMQRLWEAVVGLSAKSNSDSRKYNNLAVNASLLVTQFVSVILIIWGVYRIEEGLMTMGALIGANILLGRTMAPLMQIASLLTRVQNSQVALKALDLLMALPSENEAHRTPLDFGLLRPSFTMENVSFAYPREKRLALDRVSLHIEPGEHVGIIGTMGSGKSTLAKLLTGLYQPKEGAVKFGGVDIRQFATSELRSRVGVLPQDVVLFYGSIRDNIALGDPTINDHLILRAATVAGVSDFLRNNPAGFAAQVGEQGKELSGGQRQSVALARALVHDPEVLILDEPTSNMDTDSERQLQRRLYQVARGRTLILVTHRLSMLRLVERLIIMKEGRIVYDGPRDACDLFRPKQAAQPQGK